MSDYIHHEDPQISDQRRTWPFYLLVFSIFLALVSPHLLSDGMFLDGLIYATISRNLAEGLGGLWTPYYTGPAGTVFYEHPPFAFWLQGIFFNMFGDSIYVERIYSFMTFIVTGYLIVRIWESTVTEESFRVGWLSLFLWVITPTVFWAATNNILENTMMIFMSCSALFYIRSWSGKYHFLLLAISGSLLSLAFLTKGFTSLFPLSLPFWVWLIKKENDFLRMATDSLMIIVFTSLPLIVLFSIDSTAHDHFFFYLDHQVVTSIMNTRKGESHFSVLLFFLNDILPPLIVSGIIACVAIKKKVVAWKELKENSQWALIFFMTGLSGVIPMMITSNQSSFYILPAFVFFNLSLALWISPALAASLTRLKSIRIVKATARLLLVASLAFATAQIGTIGRDEDELNDVFKIAGVVPQGSMISISPTVADIWGLHAQFARYGHISLDSQSLLPYLVVMKGDKGIPVNYKRIDLDTSLYELYKNF